MTLIFIGDVVAVPPATPHQVPDDGCLIIADEVQGHVSLEARAGPSRVLAKGNWTLLD